MVSYQVFLSYKHHDVHGCLTEDHRMAKELYDTLTSKGVSVFFSDTSIQEVGASRYKQLIDDAMDSSSIMVVVCTNPEYLLTEWVRYEWDSFFSDTLNGVKPNSQLVSYVQGVNTATLPRTLRNVQSFDTTENGLDRVVGFILNYFGLTSSRLQCLNYDQSSYSYNEGNEKERLVVQSYLEARLDEVLIPQELAKFEQRGVNILDIGCSTGYVTNKLFGSQPGVKKVIGIDKFPECTDDFNRDFGNETFKSYCLDIESDDFIDNLRSIMNNEGIESFDMVYSALCFHHLSNPKKLLRRLKQVMSADSTIMIRTCDDGQDIFYPDEGEIIRNFLDKSSKIPGMSKRDSGREMYALLAKSGYSGIEVHYNNIDTIGKSVKERLSMFHNSFSWRKNYYKRNLSKFNSSDEAMREYRWVCETLEEIEEKYRDPLFYYCYCTPTFVAHLSHDVEINI